MGVGKKKKNKEFLNKIKTKVKKKGIKVFFIALFW